jgi:hypothetical protein
MIPLHQGVKVCLMMLFLSTSDPLTLEPPFFMFEGCEVVDSPAESPKCVGRQIEKEPEATIQNCRN